MLLVVTATAREAAPLLPALGGDTVDVRGIAATDGRMAGVPVRHAVTGFARANTAYALSRLLLDPPAAVLQFGVAGTFAPDVLPVGGVACATTDAYADLGATSDDGWVPARDLGFPLVRRGDDAWFDTFPCDADLTTAVAASLGVPSGPFATVETVTGTSAASADIAARTGAIAESMEGAAAAHACLLADVPFVQVRAASNVVGPRDRDTWRLDDAIEAAAAAVHRAIEVVADAVS